MSAARAGQLAVTVLVILGLARLLWMHGFFRGFRRARDTDAATVNLLSRMDDPPMQVVRGSYRSRKTPMSYPVDPDHQSHVDHG